LLVWWNSPVIYSHIRVGFSSSTSLRSPPRLAAEAKDGHSWPLIESHALTTSVEAVELDVRHTNTGALALYAALATIPPSDSASCQLHRIRPRDGSWLRYVREPRLQR
jgi:hypothetical protein